MRTLSARSPRGVAALVGLIVLVALGVWLLRPSAEPAPASPDPLAALGSDDLVQTTDGDAIDLVRYCAYTATTAVRFDRCFTQHFQTARKVRAAGGLREFAALRTDVCDANAGPLCAPYLRAERQTRDDADRFAAVFARELRRAGL